MKMILVVLGVVLVVGLVRMICQRQRRAAMAAGQDLLMATEAGDLEHMRALLNKRVDINATNAQGWAPLHVAAAGGNVADAGGRFCNGNFRYFQGRPEFRFAHRHNAGLGRFFDKPAPQEEENIGEQQKE
jgi:hypothetical protein